MQRIINRLSTDGLFVIIITLSVSIALLMEMATTRTTIITPKLAFATFATNTSSDYIRGVFNRGEPADVYISHIIKEDSKDNATEAQKQGLNLIANDVKMILADTSCNTDAARTDTTLQKKCDSEMSFLYEICQAPNVNTLLSNNVNTATSGGAAAPQNNNSSNVCRSTNTALYGYLQTRGIADNQTDALAYQRLEAIVSNQNQPGQQQQQQQLAVPSSTAPPPSSSPSSTTPPANNTITAGIP
jgi:hypothetical protein